MSWLERPLVRVAAVLGVLWTLLVIASVVHASWRAPRPSDFMNMYAASVVLHREGAEATYDAAKVTGVIREQVWPEVESFWPWLYPPPALLMVLPFQRLGYGWSQVVWMGGQVLLFTLGLGAALGPRRGGLLALGFPGVAVNVSFGQNGLLTGGLLGAGCALLARAPAAAGALLALVAFKPHLTLLVPLALWAGGERRALGGFLGTLTVLGLLALGLFGPATWMAWVDQLVGHTQWYQSREVPLGMIPSVYASARLLGLPGGMAGVLQGLAALLAGGALWGVWARDRRWQLRLPALVTATLLAVPKVVVYDLAMLGPALGGWLLAHGDEPPARLDRALMAAGWLLPVLASPLAERLGLPLTPLLLAWMLHRIRRRAGG